MKATTIKRLGAVVLTIWGPLAMSGVAVAQTITDEVRCVTLSAVLAKGSKDARARQLGASVGAYFLGRLDARQPAQVKAAMAAQKNIIASDASVAMKACAARAERAQVQLRALAN